jgi:hypothetical protein|tara:strand:- start:91 stop:390 length:300 start_codon:yes stop_codon:yes gene_type:complete
MKYFKHFETTNSRIRVNHFQPEGTNMCIPEAEGNADYDRMIELVEAGEAEIEEVDDTLVATWSDNRIIAYGSWREQLDMMYHGTWEDHVASVKAANPKE